MEETRMTELARAWMAAKNSPLERLSRLRESPELLSVLGGGLWATLVFVVVHFGEN
jgi:hypothetical protein